MKTLSNHTILYDADCPLCRVYTGAFVKHRLLDEQGRHPFQQLPTAWQDLVDTERAQSEIALVDRQQGKVHYGLDALFLIVSHRFPALQRLFRWRAFRWMAQRAYFFISYNRKVIAAVMPAPGHSRDCQPAFSLRYRVAYLFLAWLLTSLVLSRYALLLSGLIPAGGLYREFLVCGGQVLFQGLMVAVLSRGKTMDYLGHMMTVSLIGSAAALAGFVAQYGIVRSCTALLCSLFPAHGRLYAAGTYAAHEGAGTGMAAKFELGTLPDIGTGGAPVRHALIAACLLIVPNSDPGPHSAPAKL